MAGLRFKDVGPQKLQLARNSHKKFCGASKQVMLTTPGKPQGAPTYRNVTFTLFSDLLKAKRNKKKVTTTINTSGHIEVENRARIYTNVLTRTKIYPNVLTPTYII